MDCRLFERALEAGECEVFAMTAENDLVFRKSQAEGLCWFKVSNNSHTISNQNEVASNFKTTYCGRFHCKLQ